MRSDAGGGLTAVDLDEADLDTDADLENVDLGDFGDLDADNADLQAALTVLAVLADDISAVAEGADELAGDVDGPEGPDGPGEPGESEPWRAVRGGGPEAEGPGAAGARVVKISPDGGGEDEEIFVFGDDNDDLPAARVAVAGATADPVKDYLKQIGKVPLLNAAQEVELAKRIEAGLFAEEKLRRVTPALSATSGSTWSGSPRTARGQRTTFSRPTSDSSYRWPSVTPGGGCCSST